MNKKIISASLAAMITAASMGIPAMAEDDIKVVVNEIPVTFTEAAPFIEEGRTLVPMRAIFEALGASVEWDGETKTIVSYDPISDTHIVMQIESTKMIVNDNEYTLDVPARIVNDRTVVPVRAIAEGMNSQVDWDGETRTVIVTKDMTGDGAGDDGVQIPNPWGEYERLSGLNDALDGYYEFPELNNSSITDYRYRLMFDGYLSEGLYFINDDETGNVAIRMAQVNDYDISGIYGASELAKVKIGSGAEADAYKLENSETGMNTVYVCFENGEFTYAVIVESEKLEDSRMLELIESIAADLVK